MHRSHLRQATILLTVLLLTILGTFSSPTFSSSSRAQAATVSHVAKPPRHATAQRVGAKPYYLGLGDSLAFGFQVDLDWTDGYVEDLYYGNLQYHGVSSLTNYGCNGEKSTTMINGGCPYWYALHNYYFSPQLTAAVSFLQSHAGQVSPVTLDMGANDVLIDINKSTCAVASTWNSDLATLQTNLTTIVSQIASAMTVNGVRTGDFVMMNYYDPFAASCPNSLPYVKQLNAMIATVAGNYGVPVADVYTAFGGDNQAANICNYTWICNFIFHDIHATDTGYQVIANTIAATLGY